MSSGKILAVDIGGTKIALGVAGREEFRRTGKLDVVEKFPVPEPRTPDEVVPVIFEVGQRLLQGAELEVVGISIGGPLDHERGLVINFPHLPGWKNLPLVSILADTFGVPAQLDNDANLGALAEYWWRNREKQDPFLYLTLSTGIGGGVIVDGKLLHGLASGGGEVGHITVQTDGPLCDCGNRGCLERMASGTNIARRAREILTTYPEKGKRLRELVGGNVEQIRAETILTGYKEGEEVATEVWLEMIRYIAIGLGTLIHVISLERIVLGGGVSLAGDDLLIPLRRKLREHVHYIPVDQVDIRVASLGHDSALIGAATMVVESL